MVSAGPGPSFSLTYEVTAEDLREMLAISPILRRRRRRRAISFAGWAVLAPVATAGVAGQGPGLGDASLLGLAFLFWLLCLISALTLVRFSPRQVARRYRHNHPELAGVHRDEVGPGGVTCVMPTGISVFMPWHTFAGLRETERAFYLLDDEGDCRQALPKRGLASPDLIPPLREFLAGAVGGQSAAAPPRDPAAEPSA